MERLLSLHVTEGRLLRVDCQRELALAMFPGVGAWWLPFRLLGARIDDPMAGVSHDRIASHANALLARRALQFLLERDLVPQPPATALAELLASAAVDAMSVPQMASSMLLASEGRRAMEEIAAALELGVGGLPSAGLECVRRVCTAIASAPADTADCFDADLAREIERRLAAMAECARTISLTAAYEEVIPSLKDQEPFTLELDCRSKSGFRAGLGMLSFGRELDAAAEPFASAPASPLSAVSRDMGQRSPSGERERVHVSTPAQRAPVSTATSATNTEEPNSRSPRLGGSPFQRRPFSDSNAGDPLDIADASDQRWPRLQVFAGESGRQTGPAPTPRIGCTGRAVRIIMPMVAPPSTLSAEAELRSGERAKAAMLAAHLGALHDRRPLLVSQLRCVLQLAVAPDASSDDDDDFDDYHDTIYYAFGHLRERRRRDGRRADAARRLKAVRRLPATVTLTAVDPALLVCLLAARHRVSSGGAPAVSSALARILAEPFSRQPAPVLEAIARTLIDALSAADASLGVDGEVGSSSGGYGAAFGDSNTGTGASTSGGARGSAVAAALSRVVGGTAALLSLALAVHRRMSAVLEQSAMSLQRRGAVPAAADPSVSTLSQSYFELLGLLSPVLLGLDGLQGESEVAPPPRLEGDKERGVVSAVGRFVTLSQSLARARSLRTDVELVEMLSQPKVAAAFAASGAGPPAGVINALVDWSRASPRLQRAFSGAESERARLARLELLLEWNELAQRFAGFVDLRVARVRDGWGLSACVARLRGLLLPWRARELALAAVGHAAAASVSERVRLAVDRWAAPQRARLDKYVVAADARTLVCFPTCFYRTQSSIASPSLAPPHGQARGSKEEPVFEQVFAQLEATPSSVLRQQLSAPHIAFEVQLVSEQVAGDAGPWRELFSQLCHELQDSDDTCRRCLLSLLVPTPNAQSGCGEGRDELVLRPSNNSPDALRRYRCLGRLLGCALLTGLALPLRLNAIFWKLLGCSPVDDQDLEHLDVNFVHGVLRRGAVDVSDVVAGASEASGSNDSDDSARAAGETTPAEGDHRFAFTLSDRVVTSIEVARGTPRSAVLDSARAARINEAVAQTAAVRYGMLEVVPAQALGWLAWDRLRTALCGAPEVDLEMLKRHTVYGSGLSESSPCVRHFWAALEAFSPAERARFVRFAWGQERLPSTDDDFARRRVRMLVKPCSPGGRQRRVTPARKETQEPPRPDADQRLPRADTCFFNVELPAYSSTEVAMARLRTAISTDVVGLNGDDLGGF